MMGVGSYIRACVVGFFVGIVFLPLYASFALFRFAFGRFEREKKRVPRIFTEIHVKKGLEKKKEEEPEETEQASEPDNQLDHEKEDKGVAKASIDEIRLPDISAEAASLLKRHRAIPSIDITNKRRNRRLVGGRWESI